MQVMKGDHIIISFFDLITKLSLLVKYEIVYKWNLMDNHAQ